MYVYLQIPVLQYKDLALNESLASIDFLEVLITESCESKALHIHSLYFTNNVVILVIISEQEKQIYISNYFYVLLNLFYFSIYFQTPLYTLKKQKNLPWYCRENLK